MSGILSLLKSRKFWIAVVGGAIVAAIRAAGLPDEITTKILEIVLVLIAAIAGEDIASKLRGAKK